MDPISLTFYAVVCGLLAAAGPSLGGIVTRLVAGSAIGLLAASLLPLLKVAIAG